MKLDPSARKTAIVFVIFVIVVGYYYFIEVKHSKSVQMGKTMVNKLYPAQADKIKTIRIKNGNNTILIEKQESDYPGKWRITAPVSSLANENMADGIVFSLTDMVPERTIAKNPDPDQLKSYELGKTALETSLISAKKTTTGFFGGTTPIGSSVYFTRPDTPEVYTIALAIKEDLQKSVDFFRDRTPLHFNPDKVTSFTIKQGNESVTVLRDAPEAKWRFETAKKGETADQDKIQSFLMDFANYSVDGFYDKVPDSFKSALDVPVLEITVIQDGKPRILKLANILEDHKVTRFIGTNEIAYCLTANTDFVTSFALKRQDFISRKISDFDPWSITKLNIHKDKTDYSFAQKDEQWTVLAPATAKNHSVNMTQWLWNLREIEYLDISFLKRDKLTPTSILSVDLFTNKGKVATLSFVSVKKNDIEMIMAKRNDENKLFEVDGNVVESLTEILSKLPVPTEKDTAK